MSAGGLTIVVDDEASIGEAVGRTLNLHGAYRSVRHGHPQAIRIGAASPSLDFCQKPRGLPGGLDVWRDQRLVCEIDLLVFVLAEFRSLLR